jgi:hypothetical protein
MGPSRHKVREHDKARHALGRFAIGVSMISERLLAIVQIYDLRKCLVLRYLCIWGLRADCFLAERNLVSCNSLHL